MLGLYHLVKEMVWSTEPPVPVKSHGLERPQERDSPTLQQRFFTGVVTSVTSDSGMINDHVYFEMGVVMGGVKPEVNDFVHVEAERRHSKAGWRATRVDVTSKWSSEGRSEEEVLVGFVSGMGGGRGVACCDDQEISFPSDVATSISGYRPHINDWIKLYLLYQDEEVTINEVRPLRECSVHGEVTYVTHGYGTIQQDIHFTISACCRGYHPRKGDRVSAECVEYKHHRNNWRAYIVTPLEGTENRFESVPVKTKINSIPKLNIPLLSKGGKVVIPPIVTGNHTDSLQLPITLLEPLLPDKSLSRTFPNTIELKGTYQEKLAACRLPGQRPLRLSSLKLSTKLKTYPIPEELRDCVDEGKEDVMAMEPSLEEPLCMDNYKRQFSTLLFLEEIQREINIRQFDMNSVRLRRCGQYLSLEVPGLAEGRPSLLMGDRTIVCEPGGDEMCVHWEGYIHEVRGGDVLLRFADVFHETFNDKEFDVMFTFNRTQFRRLHHVIELASLVGPSVLFPGQPVINPPRERVVKWFNFDLNGGQRAAVARILGAQCCPAPYIVFGPPGTGKTVTLVEAILQVHVLSKGSRVLVCAPSNSAADLLCDRLSRGGCLSPGEIVRLNAIQRPSSSMPNSILPYCKDTNSADSAARSPIVVATCSTAGILHGLGLRVGHFSHVFVDEAGQATEPECLLPLAILAQSINAQVILAGDPCQLGPVLSSQLAGGCGLGLSLLERLMEHHAYQRDEKKFKDHGNYDPLLVTKLLQNYRSHSQLLKLYSELFYHGELEVCAPPTKTDILLEWEGLPTKGFPLVFHGVLGEDMQEGNSPSWFNPVEALQVVKYIQALKDNATFAPRLCELGVITPYRKQVEKIRQLLVRLGCDEREGGGVKVGSVEEFQGQERTAIIISTVRSSVDLLDFDNLHHLGFLSNPKRFNVAISRACALLVVVGNPFLLSKDPYWSKLLEYAVEHHAYIGCDIPDQYSSPHSVSSTLS